MDPEAKPAENDETQQSSSLSDIDSDIDSSSSSSSSSSSAGDRDGPGGSDASDSAAQSNGIEWLATARERRATAGNRMKSMLANEEPDSDLELLFAEDEDDQGFSDVDDDGSDVQMDSSSDDDDDNNAAGGDDLEGEKELERQAKERRTAQRKRKAQDAIPAKFKKKVRIDPTSSSSRATPAPRPKKKSERASWLPSVADLPTRASSRQTTRLSKEQLHQQMVEREAKRLKQVAQMEKKAAKLEALKKPPMTQEERLHEAALVEKRNSKSLNRWEVAEKQREEERMAKLAALNERKLKGPVITFWSGMGEWVDGSLKNVGQHMVVEEQPKKKRERVDKVSKSKEKDKDKDKDQEKDQEKDKDKTLDNGQEGQPDKAKVDVKMEDDRDLDEKKDHPTGNPVPTQPKSSPEQPPTGTTPAPTEGKEKSPKDATNEEAATTEPAAAKSAAEPITSPPSTLTPIQQDEAPRPMVMPPKPPVSGLAAPQPPPPPSSPPHNQGSLAAPSGMSRLHEPKPSSVLAAPVLAPPPGIDMGGASTPMLGYSVSTPKSNVLAPPNTSQRPSPPSIPTPAAEKQPTPDRTSAAPEPPARDSHLQPITNEAAPSKSASPRHSEPPPGSTTDPAANRNAIVYQNFDENCIRDKSVQTQILFGRKMNKLSKPTPAPVCVITNHPARYRDPKTGLPYYNTYAYREIQRLGRGDYRWSKILGAWVGSGAYAACGVPERFLHPDRKPPAAAAGAASTTASVTTTCTTTTTTTKTPDAAKADDETPKLESAADEEISKVDQPLIQPKVEEVEVVQAGLTVA